MSHHGVELPHFLACLIDQQAILGSMVWVLEDVPYGNRWVYRID